MKTIARQHQTRGMSARCVALFVFMSLALWTLSIVGSPFAATASQLAAPATQAATPEAVDSEGAPAPVSTSEPGGTGPAPQSVATDQAALTPENTSGGQTTDGLANPPSDGGSFPWLPVLGVLALVVAGLGFAFFRQRGPAVVVETGSPSRLPSDSELKEMGAPAGTDGMDSAASSITTSSTVSAPAPATSSEMPPAVPPPAAPVSSVSSVTVSTTVDTMTCPNCGAANQLTEKFCHDCGQDLRALMAQIAASRVGAPAGPQDIVDANTPYLETLDRVQEQLEFVLSRPRVIIGTAPANDIVIDAAFKGWRSVSPVHAELLHEADSYRIIDRDSEYGTFVNEMRTGENILADGDTVRLGDVRFTFRIPTVGE